MRLPTKPRNKDKASRHVCILLIIDCIGSKIECWFMVYVYVYASAVPPMASGSGRDQDQLQLQLQLPNV